ncbi:MAG TPA: anti-sigma factor [Planctomycetota bacterium]
MSDVQPTRREELMADGALAWLDGVDAAAFAAVMRDPAAAAEFAAFERAVATATVACVGSAATEQTRLLQLTARLEADAQAFFAARDGRVRPLAAARSPWSRLLPWAIAAASLSFAFWPQAAAVAPAAARASLLRSAAHVVQCAWQPGPSPRRGAVDGDVVWDAERQEGYLRLRGLPPLDPSQRYQLWIVDAERSGPPVDGGLLTLPPAAGEAVVRVSPRLPVGRAAAFVLTVERAEGAVVSAQEHVVAIARP